LRRPHAGAEGPAPDDDRYLVVARPARGELREQGSRFLADCLPVADEAEARRRVAAIAAAHHDATHHAWGLRVGHGAGSVGRAHDAGEPPGTAGAPILAAIDRRGLTGTLVVVTRWFGGVKLGTAGLARCYGAAAARALDAAGVEERFLEARIPIRVDHADLPAVQRIVYGAGGRFAAEAYGAVAHLSARVRRSREAEIRRALVEGTAGRVRFEEGRE
jgi:putative IMPACT (imprinted ancient) family translation regulator